MSLDINHKKLWRLFAVVTLPFLLNGFYLEPLFRFNSGVFWVIEISESLVLPLGVVIYCVKSRMLSLSDLGLRAYRKPYDRLYFSIIFTVIFAVGLFIIYLKLYYFFHRVITYDPLNGSFSHSDCLPENISLRTIAVVYFAITAGVFEEILFRGMLKRLLSSKTFYVFVSSSLFAVVHWESGFAGLLVAFVFGSINALVFIQFNTLWPCILGHIFTDWMIFSYIAYRGV